MYDDAVEYSQRSYGLKMLDALPAELVGNISSFAGFDGIMAMRMVSLSVKHAVDEYGEIQDAVITINERDCMKELLNIPKIFRGASIVVNDKEILDSHLVYLQKFKNVNIRNCCNITNIGLENLKHCKVVDVSYNYNITDDGLKNLGEILELNLEKCNRISDAGLEHVRKVRKLNLAFCSQITNVGLSKLDLVECLTLVGNWFVTDIGIANLKNLSNINIVWCGGISKEARGFLLEKGISVINHK